MVGSQSAWQSEWQGYNVYARVNDWVTECMVSIQPGNAKYVLQCVRPPLQGKSTIKRTTDTQDANANGPHDVGFKPIKQVCKPNPTPKPNKQVCIHATTIDHLILLSKHAVQTVNRPPYTNRIEKISKVPSVLRYTSW
jgi:hypothetical protein